MSSKPKPGQKPGQPAERVETRPLTAILPYERNARTHSDEQIELLANLMLRYGVDQPIVVDEAGVILKGHGRRLAAIKAGFKTFPVVIHRGLSDDDKRALRIADNQVALLAGWDQELVRLEVGELKLHGFDLPLLGFGEAELASFLDTNPGLTDPDEVPEAPAEPVSRPGDLWVLGRHRLLCGDATNADDVAKVLAHLVKVDCIIADPPYGMHLDTDFSEIKGSLGSLGRKHGTRGNRYDLVIGDDEDFDPAPLINRFAVVAEQFWFGADYYAERIPQRGNGSWLVWDKRKESQADAIGSEFELCWSRQKHKRRMLRHDWFGFLSSENGSDARSRVHPTQKPVTLIVDIMPAMGKIERHCA